MYMKRTQTLLLLLGAFALQAVLPVMGRERTQSEIFSVAQKALHQKGLTRSRVQNAVAPSQLQIMNRTSQLSIVGYADGGYAVVGNDDRLPALLAYCEGTYEEAVANPNFVSYMSAFNTYLDECEASGTEPRFMGLNAVLGHPEGVKEIMKCKWDQGEPYNYMTPTLYRLDEDRRSATGCVATALAQIIYTLYQKHGVEARPRGMRRYFYLNGDKRSAYVNANLSALDMNWKAMKNTYSSTTGYNSNMAVARLMYACGVVSMMTYAPGESGAYCYDTHDGVNLYFDGVRSVYTGYGLGAYEQMIYDELDAGRPFLVSGNNGVGGHAFVADGYDSEGRLHLNMGWSGGGNGYFAIADMNGFTNAQTANFIVPDANSKLYLSNEKPLAELQGLYATADLLHPATSVETDRWYVLYNAGMFSSIYSSGIGQKVRSSNYIVANDPTETVASMLVRFVPQQGSADTYYIQTGTGDYLGKLTSVSNQGSVTSQSVPYTLSHMFDKDHRYFWLKQGETVVECHKTSSNGICQAQGSLNPDSLGAKCWMLLPAHLSATEGDMNCHQDLFEPTHRYTISPLGAPTTMAVNMRTTCQLTKSEGTQFILTPHGEGWYATMYKNDQYVLSAKSSGFKTGNGATATDVPLDLIFEPTSQKVETDDVDFNETSRVFRIRTEAGYLGCEKLAEVAAVFCNKGVHAANTLWVVTDRTVYDERTLPEGIAAPACTPEQSRSTYDLQGRPLTTTPAVPQLRIENGRKKL